MTLHQEIQGEVARLALCGDFDMFSRDEFLDEVDRLIEQGARKLVVDMRRVPFVSSNGISALLGAHVRMRAMEGLMVLAHPVREIRQTLDMLGLTERLPVVDGAEAFGVSMR
jgi:anti-sigma B factor antagonist